MTVEPHDHADELATARRRLAQLQEAAVTDLRAAAVENEELRSRLVAAESELDATRRRLSAVTSSRTYRTSRGLRLVAHPGEAWRRLRRRDTA